jgi:geranylgeranyl transferase type-2 subunit alpha
MHGRPKLDRPPTQSEIETDQKKSQTYQQLVGLIVAKRSQNDMSNETFDLIEQFLIKNPDYYSLWNYRKVILIHRYPEINLITPSSSSSSNNNKSNNENLQNIHDPEIVEKEMQLSQKAILKNPKSYGAWYHRIWILQRFEVNINHEIELCNRFLVTDQRNFHCWNYRRYLIDNFSSSSSSSSSPSPSPSIVSEYQYTTNKLSENFSNYSAYHHRSIYLPLHLATATTTTTPSPASPPTPACLTDLLEILEMEFQLIENAIFTEPDDQSAWWYDIFLMQYLSYLLHSTAPSPPSPPAATATAATATAASSEMSLPVPTIPSTDWHPLCLFVLENYAKQYHSLQELFSMESSCKWILIGLLTLNQSIEALLTLQRTQHCNPITGTDQQEFSWNVPERSGEYDEYLTRLCELDGNRAKCHQYRFGGRVAPVVPL